MPLPPAIPSFDSLPASVRTVVETLRRGGFQVFLVGGGVRDLALGQSPRDWDVATDAVPEQLLGLFPGSVPTGIQFGTVTVITGGEKVEVTTFRSEGDYQDGRRPSRVSFGTRVEEDLARRDFTVNAMAIDPLARRWVDPHRGLEDAEKSLLRAVGNPEDRFREDGLRLLRAVRLAAQLGFVLEPSTWRALGSARGKLLAVAPERCREELERILSQPAPRRGLELLACSGLLYLLLPEMYAHPAVPVAQALAAGGSIPANWRLWRWAALLLGARAPASVWERLRFSRAEARTAQSIHAGLWKVPGLAPRLSAARRWLADLDQAGDPPPLQALVQAVPRLQPQDPRMVNWLGELAAEPFPRSPRELAVDGHRLQECLGLAPGPYLGRLLQKLWEETLEDPGRNREAFLLERARQLQKSG